MQLEIKKEQTVDLFRFIIERSIMSNNDEIVGALALDLKLEQNKEFLNSQQSKNGFDEPRLVLSRPILKEEIKQGLDVTFFGRREKENCPDLTRMLDAFFLLAGGWSFWKDYTNISSYIAKYIATSFYNCMSGGIPHAEVSLIHHICSKLQIELTTPVYPGKTKDVDPNNEYASWYTIKDFLDETKERHDKFYTKEIEQFLPKLLGN